jgi:hypothetical protein
VPVSIAKDGRLAVSTPYHCDFAARARVLGEWKVSSLRSLFAQSRCAAELLFRFVRHGFGLAVLPQATGTRPSADRGQNRADPRLRLPRWELGLSRVKIGDQLSPNPAADTFRALVEEASKVRCQIGLDWKSHPEMDAVKRDRVQIPTSPASLLARRVLPFG